MENPSAVPRHPPMLSYVDNVKHRYEIYISPGRWNEANELLENENWDALSRFPPWSDQPALPTREANQMNYTDGRNGTEKSVYLPPGSSERARQLFMQEDWASLESEFEDWAEQEPTSKQRERYLAHERGVERMRIAREQPAKAEQGQVD